MPNSDYICRKALPADDIRKIAEYIYLTDPYIYPTICDSPDNEDWVDFIRQCTLEEKNIYSLGNLSVVLCENKIVGVMCTVPCGKELTFAEEISVPEKFQKSIKPAENGYFKPLIAESLGFTGHNVVNLCIDNNHRGKGLGGMMMSHCISEYGEKDIHLDVIAVNTSAVQLYKKHGFETISEYMGFSGNESELPCMHMLRKAEK